MSKDLVFSIVTPTRNSEKYISEAIESVISQAGDFCIEYLIVDNCSNDATVDIIRRYQKELQSGVRPLNCNGVNLYFISEKDTGMYDAISKGFSQVKGDICAWINSDDIYLNGCFNGIDKIFKEYSDVRWVKGITSYINKDSTIFSIGKCNLYAQEWIVQGLYGPVLGFIQQDSVFWRRDLWNAVDGVNTKLNLAGDYDLWRRFAKLSPLYSFNAYLSCFRKVSNQKSENLDEYWKEIDDIDDIITSNQKIKKRALKYENKRKTYPRVGLIKSVYIHQYHLITVDSDGRLELQNGNYECLQKYL